MLTIRDSQFKYRHLSPVPDLYIDVDGTISDFYRYFSHKFLPEMKKKKITVDEIGVTSYRNSTRIRKYIHTRIANKPIDFWAKIPTTIHGRTIINETRRFNPRFFIGVLPNDQTMEFGKVKWCRRKLRFKDRHLDRILINKNKSEYAVTCKGVRNILIDDDIFACEAWEAAGGIAYLYIDNKLIVDRIVDEVYKDMSRHISLDFMLEWNDEQGRYCW